MIRDLSPDRAPGPDGFTGCFYKVAWEEEGGALATEGLATN
jgi:hypothetical protein